MPVEQTPILEIPTATPEIPTEVAVPTEQTEDIESPLIPPSAIEGDDSVPPPTIEQEGEEGGDEELVLFPTLMRDDLNSNKLAKPRRIQLTGGVYRTNIHSPKANAKAKARGKYAFVKKVGEPLTFGKYGHEHLAKGAYVEYAGEATFNSGELLFWSNSSGHYRPTVEAMRQAGLPEDKFVPIKTVDDEAVRLATKNTKNPRKLAALFGVEIEEIQKSFNRLGIEKRGGGSWNVSSEIEESEIEESKIEESKGEESKGEEDDD
jgi:hypothetical protein